MKSSQPQLKATEEAARRKAAEEAQQRTLEQMRKMASKYSNDDATTTIRVIDDSPLASGLAWPLMKIHLSKKTVKLNAVAQPLTHVLGRKVVVVVKKSKALLTITNVV